MASVDLRDRYVRDAMMYAAWGLARGTVRKYVEEEPEITGAEVLVRLEAEFDAALAKVTAALE